MKPEVGHGSTHVYARVQSGGGEVNIQERGVTVAQAARDLGVHGTVLRRWVLESAADAAQAFSGQGQMKPEQANSHGSAVKPSS